MTTVSVFYFAACLSIVGRYLWSSKILTLVFSHTMYFLRVLSGRVGWKTECSKVSSTEVHPQLTSLEYFRFGLDFSMLPIVAHFRVGIQTLQYVAQFSYGPSFRTKRALFDYFRGSFKSWSTEEFQK